MLNSFNRRLAIFIIAAVLLAASIVVLEPIENVEATGGNSSWGRCMWE